MKKIVIISTVKNESDIIESFCRYNLSYGDCMLIRESHKSYDNTREIIQKLIDEGLPIYFEAEEADMYYESVKAILVDIAVEKYRADLVIQLDADEFITHIDGINPRETLEALKEDIEYQIPWRTYIYDHEPDENSGFVPNNFPYYRNPAFENILGYAGKAIASRYLLKEKQAKYTFGGHALNYPDEYADTVKMEVSDILECAHYPIRSHRQVMCKAIPNYITKWIMPEHLRWTRDVMNRYQLGVLFNAIKEYGSISFEKMKEISITYSLDNEKDKEKTEKLIQELGRKIAIEGKMDTSFCADVLNIKYTGVQRNDKTHLVATLNTMDTALQHLDSESRGKTQEIIALEGVRDNLAHKYNEALNELKDLTEKHKSLEEQRDVLQARIDEILSSRAWKIGSRIARIARFFIPGKAK